jgi:hypothetical protein
MSPEQREIFSPVWSSPAPGREPDPIPLWVSPAPYVLIPVAAAMTGYSPKAIRAKIDKGQWLAGREYVRAPDGRVLVSVTGFSKWVESGHRSQRARLKRSKRPEAPSGMGTNPGTKVGD